MTTEHEIHIKQAPGWWPNLVHAVCSCGWSGPVRNAYNEMFRWPSTFRRFLEEDGREHQKEMHG